jgi:WD40 repeat protein
MRILPRSAKGTWLLAAAVWVGLCGIAWWVTPVVPRAEWTVPEPCQLEGFLPDGKELLTSLHRIVWDGGCMPVVHRDDPFRVWKASTGRLLGTYQSRDLSPFPERRTPNCPPNTEFEAVSPDGGSLAASVREGESLREIGVWEAGSLRRIGTIPMPAGVKYVKVYLSSAGKVLAASSIDPQKRSGDAMCWETATGRELLRVADAWGQMALSPDGNTLVTISDRIDSARDGMVGYALSAWDVGTGRKRFTLGLAGHGFVVNWDSALISHDGQTIAAPTGNGPVDPLGNLARRLGISWPFGNLATGEHIAIFDAATGRELGNVSGKFDDSVWSPDGKQLATLDRDRQLVRVWDIPPRKPLTWFALAAAVLALPLAWLARRRVRQLRREVA